MINGEKRKDDERPTALACLKELGDCLWYVSQCARLNGFTLQEIAEANIKKLSSRAKRGKLHGAGGNR